MKAEMEALQNRRMMSVAASVGAGTLYVYGDNDGNGLAIEMANGMKDIVIKKYVDGANYQEFYRTKAAKVQNIKVYGQGGPDTITVDDYIQARVTINGGAGADYLQPGGLVATAYGHDEVSALTDDNAADMLVTGGSGECHLLGQGGDDRFYMDRSNVQGIGGTDHFFGGTGNDRFYAKRDQRYGHVYDGGSGNDTIDFSSYDAPTGVRIALDGSNKSGTQVGDSRERNHRIKANIENAVGSEFADFITAGVGTTGANKLYGLGGNDTIQGYGGNDIIEGDAGDDSLDGGNGDDSLYGDDGKDEIFGGIGKDRLRGGNQNDVLKGGSDADKLYGDAGNDTIFGQSGADILVGGGGSDLMDSRDGVGGNDVLFANAEDGAGSSAYDRAMINLGVPLNDFVYGFDAVAT